MIVNIPWLAGKFTIYLCTFKWENHRTKWGIFHCHVWLPKGSSSRNARILSVAHVISCLWTLQCWESGSSQDWPVPSSVGQNMGGWLIFHGAFSGANWAPVDVAKAQEWVATELSVYGHMQDFQPQSVFKICKDARLSQSWYTRKIKKRQKKEASTHLHLNGSGDIWLL